MKDSNFKMEGTMLHKYLGADKRVVIPEGVTEISDEAFESNQTVEVIEIPNTVKSIDAWLFFECDNLRNIIINNDNPYMTKIDDCIYSKDKSVLLLYPPYLTSKSFKIPSFVSEIGRTAFYRSAAEKIICNSGLKKIGEGAFFSCFNLKEIDIPDTVTEIGAEAFLNCKSLSKIKIPHGVTVIGPSTFEECTSLQDVILPRSIKTIDENAFNNCINLKFIPISNSI